jgi:hypothetical protein
MSVRKPDSRAFDEAYHQMVARRLGEILEPTAENADFQARFAGSRARTRGLLEETHPSYVDRTNNSKDSGERKR